MDDTRPLSDPRSEQSNSPQENPSGNNEPKPATPRNVSRTITSKRVVIPPAAKRGASAPPPSPASVATQQIVEQSEVIPDAPPLVIPVQPPPPPEPVQLGSKNGDNAAYMAAAAAAAMETPPVVEPPSVIEPPLEAAAPTSSTATPLEPPAPIPPPAPPQQVEPPPAPTSELRPQPFTPREPVTPKPAAVAPATVTGTDGSSKPTTTPYAPSPSFTPLPVVETPRKRRSLQWLLWLAALLLLLVAAFLVVPLLFPNLLPISGVPNAAPTATQIVLVDPTNAPQATTTQLPTGAATAVANLPTAAPLIIPTPPADGQQASLLPDTALTGWSALGEEEAHFGDENLHAGTFQGKNLESIVQFNLRNLPTDTKILFAAVELTGRDGSRLGSSGEWSLDLVQNSLATDWFESTPDQISAAQSLTTIGTTLPASELGTGRLNRFILSESERQLLEQQFQNGNAVFRLRGPATSEDDLFTWESGASGSALNAPTLHLVFTPGRYVIVTNTPEPTNVLTAAAYVVRGTDQAKRLGTPTRFPPGVATATPGGEFVPVAAETAIAQNEETAVAMAQRATAFARTTGTYTPTPLGQVIIFPTETPVVIDPARLATSTPIPPDADLLSIPIDYAECNCQGQIIALSNRYGGTRPELAILLGPDGTELGQFQDDFYYRLATARETWSPDRTRRIIYPKDSRGVQQVGYEDVATREITFITDFPKGIQYDAAWSPDGNYIAYVTTERGNTDEIWVYDLGAQTNTPITDSSELGQPWNKRPSWSPDSSQIVFWSSRFQSGPFGQIWVMNRDGSNPINISNNTFDERDPVWVK